MDYEGRLRGDLEATIAEHRGEAGVAELAEEILDRDRGSTYLIGLQHNCARVRYYCRAIEAIEDRPASIGRVDGPDPLDEPVHSRDDVHAVIVNEAWSWLHPRYRWVGSAGWSECAEKEKGNDG